MPFRKIELHALVLAAGLLLAAPGWALDDIAARLNAGVEAEQVQAAAAVSWQAGERRTHYVGIRAEADPVPPDGATRFGIGSITKPFTAMLLAERVANGELAYDVTIGDVLSDDFEPSNPAMAAITLEQLVTHTSGLPRLPANLDVAANPSDPYADYDGERLVAGLQAARAGQPLGHGYAYSNFGAGALGWLLGHDEAGGYEGALYREVIRPLRLENTDFEPGENAAAAYAAGTEVPAWTFDALAGAGALWSSADDLIRLAEVLLGARPNPLRHSQRVDFEPVAQAGHFQVSRIWHMIDSPFGTVYWHNGGTAGHRSFFGVRPATSDALVVLVAGGGFDPTGDGLQWFGVEAAEPKTVDVDASVLGQYALGEAVGIGVFEADAGQGLRAQLSGQPAVPVEAIGDDWYRFTVADASLHFLREDGAVVAVELVQDGRVQRATKTGERAAVLDRDDAAIEVDPAELAAFVGEYALNPQMRFTVRQGGESGLEVGLTGQPFFPVYARGEDVFFYKVVEAELHFERDEAGAVVAVVLHQGGIVQRAARID